MSGPTYHEFKELGSDLKELQKLETIKGGTYVPGSGRSLIVQLYFPDRTGSGHDNVFMGEIKVRERIDARTERMDANVIVQNCLSRYDTRQPPVFFSIDEYEKAKKDKKIIYSVELFHVLSRKPGPLYYVHSGSQR
jgi:hypothetical protein